MQSAGFKTQRLMKRRYYFMAIWNYENGARGAKKYSACPCISFARKPAKCSTMGTPFPGVKMPWCYTRRGCRNNGKGAISKIDRRTPWGYCDSETATRAFPKCASKLDFSEAACKAAAQKAGYKVGGKGSAFAGNWGVKGCYAYKSGKYKGHAYYGRIGRRDVRSRREMRGLRTRTMLRLENYPRCGASQQKMVSKGCWADGGRERARKSGRRRAVPKYIGAFGCGQAGKNRCMAAAKNAGMSIFSMQCPHCRCQCFIGNSLRQAQQFGRSRRCNNRGEGGGWANEVYVIEDAAPTVFTRTSPWMLTNNWEYAQKWYKNPRQAWNRPSGNQRPKAVNFNIWMGRDYFQLISQKGDRTWHEKAQMVGRLMWGRYVDPECQRVMNLGRNRNTVFGIWQSTPTGEWRSAVYRNGNRSRNYWTWRRQQ